MDGGIVQSGENHWCVATDSINVTNLTVKNGGSQIFRSDSVVIGPNSTVEEGGYLSVEMGSGIYKHINDVDTNDEVQESEIVTDQNGRRIAITKMGIVFKPDATQQQMNQLLTQLNATITSSVNFSRGVVVRIPKPASLSAYLAQIDQAEAQTYVDFVSDGDMGELSELPSTIDFTDKTELEHIDNHLAVRAHGAWNVRQAINNIPKIVIADRFGKSTPSSTMYNTYSLFKGSFTTESSTTSLTGHGYGVLGVIAGSYDQNYTTGIFPGSILLGVIDKKLGTGCDINTLENDIIKFLRDSTGKIVLNTSINFQKCGNYDGHCQEVSKIKPSANYWIERVRMNGLEGRVLHVTSAGNCEGNFDLINDAETKSTFSAARLLGGIIDYGGHSVNNLKNTIVVENAYNTPADTALNLPITIECLSKKSFTGGDVTGIGEDVYTYTGTGTAQTEKNGTSYSAPQVAGLAAYIWSIAPSLTPEKIITLITENAEPMNWFRNDLPQCRENTPAAPFVDAYEALLSLDAADTPSKTNSPVRFALLDVNNDKVFNENDLTLFYNEYYTSNIAVTTANDFSRYDLNGDGWTSPDKSSEPTAFDLDRTGSIQYGKPILNDVIQDIAGRVIEFNENSVTDKDILCYYAYSPLYTGDTTARDGLIKDPCIETVMYNGPMWLRGGGIYTSKAAAITYCENLETGGYTNWRLPTKEELKGLVWCSNDHPIPLNDHDRCDETLPPDYAPWPPYSRPTIDLSTFSCEMFGYWTIDDSGYYGWYVNFTTGLCTQSVSSSSHRVRCVRFP